MICIPMAGGSTRFYNAGYLVPKFQLEIRNVPLFRMSLMSFSRYFESESFLFILNKKSSALDFVKKEAKALQLKNYSIVELDGDTRGQAETVALGLKNSNSDIREHLLVFNIDTIRIDFRYPSHFPNFPWLEVFVADGDHWSFVSPIQGSDEVSRVVEKTRISDYCSTGMYFFPTIQEYLATFDYFMSDFSGSEAFVAPLYQRLIDRNKVVKYSLIDSKDIFLAGTPDEFTSLNPDALFQALKI
jgi:hypothetical protein